MSPGFINASAAPYAAVGDGVTDDTDALQARPALPVPRSWANFQVSLPDSHAPFCMLNRHRELTLPRLTAAHCHQLRVCLTFQFLWRQAALDDAYAARLAVLLPAGLTFVVSRQLQAVQHGMPKAMRKYPGLIVLHTERQI